MFLLPTEKYSSRSKTGFFIPANHRSFVLLVIIIVGFFSKYTIIPGFFIHTFTLSFFFISLYTLIHSLTNINKHIPGRLIFTAVFVLCLLFSWHSTIVVVIAPLHTLTLSQTFTIFSLTPLHSKSFEKISISEILFKKNNYYIGMDKYFRVSFISAYVIHYYFLFFHDHARFWVLWIVLHFKLYSCVFSGRVCFGDGCCCFFYYYARALCVCYCLRFQCL